MKSRDDWPTLAILYDKTSLYSPSNDAAIDQFCTSAEERQIKTKIIGKEDISNLSHFDALFIRDTTHPENYAYDFSLSAELKKIPVLDTTEGIMKGCNKIWQTNAFFSYNIPFPNSMIINVINYEFIHEKLTYPCVLKIHDSCFSQGVFLIHDKKEFFETVERLILNSGKATNRNLICQEFIKTAFDWRITFLDRKPLFACKYHMIENDWKIIKYDKKGNYIEGVHEAITIESIPSKVMNAAYLCISLMDKGLYGIDIKETNNSVYVIEINDNPSIDAGTEDTIYGKAIYDKIIEWFKIRIILGSYKEKL